MLFRPRERPSLSKRVQWLVWPRRGWRRAGTYVLHRLRRLPGSPGYIAMGFAFGAAVSFTPFVGLHFAIAALLAWSLGGSVVAAAIGTAVGNPWTFPFIWLASHRLGNAIVGGLVTEPLPEELTMRYIFTHPTAVLVPMAVGGVLLGIVAWFLAYWLVKRIVERYQQIRQKRLSVAAARSDVDAARKTAEKRGEGR